METTLRVRVEQLEGETKATLRIIFTNDLEKDFIIGILKKHFEIEILSAEILEEEKFTTISIATDNQDKINSLKKNINNLARQLSGIDKINYN